MKTVADKAIPFVEPFFRSLGEIRLFDGRQITPALIHDADVLLVRTVTRVDKTLLEGSSVRFVATATSGRDHIDTEYLAEKNIGFAHAAGCNARSVAEYVLSSLLSLTASRGVRLEGKTAGIIGYGHVGTVVKALFDCVGIRSLIYDPPLQSHGSHLEFSGLDEVLTADIVTLHVPLINSGPYPTRNLVNNSFLNALCPNVILINTSRGEVVDEQALATFMTARPGSAVVLDVWKNEPVINAELLQQVSIATAHIAGYSLDSKYRGTRMIYAQVCEYFNEDYSVTAFPQLPPTGLNQIEISEYNDAYSTIQLAALASYDVRTDDSLLRQMLTIPASVRGEFFAGLRNNYAVRREFTGTSVRLAKPDVSISDKLTRLGFLVE
jgi:erythronate-4-phosphate dehydrogenase